MPNVTKGAQNKGVALVFLSLVVTRMVLIVRNRYSHAALSREIAVVTAITVHDKVPT